MDGLGEHQVAHLHGRKNEAVQLPKSRLAAITALDLWIARLNHRQEPLAGQKGRLWEFCGTHIATRNNSEQNEQMKRRQSVRAITCKFMKTLMFGSRRSVEHHVIRNQ